MSAPTIVTLRPGVQFTPSAAASFRRLEATLGRRVDVNSTYRDWDTQMGMYLAWTAYANGRGPKPWHSRAVHPKYSIHCQGNALDSDDWRTPGFIALAAKHGWIRTAASDPTEQHHFEYQTWRDQYINDPAPAGTAGEDDMPYTPDQLKTIVRDAIIGLQGNDGNRNILDSQKQARDDIAALAREVSDVGGKVWRNPLTGPDGRTLPAKDYLRYVFDLHRTLTLEMRALNVDALDKLTDAQLDAYAKAAAGEQARRSAS